MFACFIRPIFFFLTRGGWCLLCALFYAPVGQAEIGIIFPDVSTSYKEVVKQIVLGIESRAAPGEVKKYVYTHEGERLALLRRLESMRDSQFIALGRGGVELAQQAGLRRVIVGGLMMEPGERLMGPGQIPYPLISLQPEPEIFFRKLREFVPSVKRVFVVYEAHKETRLIALAREAARARGIHLEALESDGMRASARLFKMILREAQPVHDAIWLLQNESVLDERTLLPFILQEVWERRLILFSSNPSHVKRGSLFAVYPDNFKLGQELLTLTRRNEDLRAVELLRGIAVAGNLRTASHLGLDETMQQREQFDMVFPAP